MSLDIGHFFWLTSKLSSSYVQVSCKELIDTGTSDLLTGNYQHFEFPLEFVYQSGHKWGDLLGTGWPSLFLISERMTTLMDVEDLTGWRTFPVIVTDKFSRSVHNYAGLSILGRCGPIDYTKSEIIEKRLVPEGPPGKYYKGLHVGLDKWDGSDFFLAEGTTHPIITQRAANIFKRNRLQNVRLRNLAVIETPDFALRPSESSRSKPLSAESLH